MRGVIGIVSPELPELCPGIVTREVAADIPVTARPDKVHQHIGHLAREDMVRVEQALGLVLGFAG